MLHAEQGFCAGDISRAGLGQLHHLHMDGRTMTVMHTKDRLAQVLRNMKLDALAERAADGEFDDFLSDHVNPQMVLADELAKIGNTSAMYLRKRLINGDFDATKEESEAWAQSPEGRAVFDR